MKKNYTTISLLFTLLFSFSCFAKTDILNILPPITATAIVTQQVSCAGGNNGSVTIQATGGTGIFTYSLSYGGIIIPAQSSATFTGLQAGNYSYQVTDSMSTIFNGTFIIYQPYPLTCTTAVFGNNVAVTATGGSAPYIYSFGNGALFESSGIFANLQPGVYSFEVKDSQGCICNSQVIISPDINISATSTYVDFNNDGFTNVGDIVTYAFTVTNNNLYDPITAVNVTSPNCTIAGATIASLLPNTNNSTNFTGTHVITQAEINAGSVLVKATSNGTLTGNIISSTITNTKNLTISSGIKLVGFVDVNANNIQDNGEVTYNQGNFSYQLNGGTPISAWGNATNEYVIYENNSSNLFNLSFVNNNTLAYSLVTANYSNVSVANGSGITTYYFPLTANSYTDAEVNLFGISVSPRPGFTYSNRVFYKNNGSQNISTGTITFTKDNLISITSTSPATTSNTTGFTYTFTNLAAGASGFIDVLMQVPTIPTVSLGTILTNSASISVASDAASSNNNENLSQTIVGSYDPNDKTESHGEKILFSTFGANDYLNYTIQFENTGTANAVNVKVTDVLDARLDQTSIRMINASSPNVVKKVENTLTWDFNGIELPPSVANTQIGHGFINFTIKPKPGFAVGDIIFNKANIYFDFNPAIITNNCKTEFVATLKSDDFVFNNFNFYPNPVENTLTISNNFIIDSLEISSLLGQTILNKKINDLQSVIDLSSLSSGVYIAKFFSEGSSKRIKIVKK